MARIMPNRLPRGINFLLGGIVVALGFLMFALLGGSLNLGIGGAPQVRIESNTASQ